MVKRKFFWLYPLRKERMDEAEAFSASAVGPAQNLVQFIMPYTHFTPVKCAAGPQTSGLTLAE